MMSLRTCRRSGGAMPIIALGWLLAGVIAISHSAMQYVSANGGGASLPQGTGLAGCRSAHAGKLNKVRRFAEGAEDAEPEAPPNVGWGPEWTGKEAIVAVSLLSVLALCLSQFDPWSMKKGSKTEGTLPLTGVFRSLGNVADKVVPSLIAKHKGEQQDLVTSLAVMVPIVAGVLSKSDAIDVGFLGDTKGIEVLEIGKVYEAKDSTLNWRPVLVQSANDNGSYTCKIVQESVNFDAEPVWPEVWSGNCRIVRRPEAVQKEQLANCAA